jgi:hypothetical protein
MLQASGDVMLCSLEGSCQCFEGTTAYFLRIFINTVLDLAGFPLEHQA